ncbi:MAG TPA: hypothetical protein VNJ70_10540 [Thermoanaerobaculia bacterium]|nr:hypothetical protein [Thermoanaerobaculia bacterium]
MVYGSVTATGQPEGVGFTATRSSKGIYAVSFERRFNQPPTVVVVINDQAGNDDIAKVNQVNRESFIVQISDIPAGFVRDDARFSFIALGRRN